MSLRTGILSNPNNEISNRMSRNVTHQSTSARHARESPQLTDASTQIKVQLKEAAEKRRKSNAATKLLNGELKTNKATSGKNRSVVTSCATLAASSSGRVKPASTHHSADKLT